MRKVILFMLLLSSFTAFAQDNTVINDKNIEVRNIKPFHAIKVSNGIDLFLSYGDEAAAVSAAESKYRDKIKLDVENGILKIWYDDTGKQLVFNNKRDLRAYVSYKNLDALTASSGSDIRVDGVIKGNSLVMKISSGSDFKGNVDVNELTIDQSSGSDIDMRGRANKVVIEASSGSDFDGYNLLTEVCTATASSGSDISITVNKELTAKAISGSDIRYRGNASLVSITKSRAGSVKKI